MTSPYFDFEEGTAPDAPASGKRRLYAKSDGYYEKDSSGTETALNGAGGGGLDTPTELTISSGAVTKTGNYHSIDTEADAASDDLDTINGGTTLDELTIYAANDARTVVIKNSTGNILTYSGNDISLDEDHKLVRFIYDGTNWRELSNADDQDTGGGSSLPVADTTSIVEGSADATKEFRLEVDGLTTATTRVGTVPDKDFTLGLDDDAIHDNVAGEINALTEKVTPVSADLVIIEDSADSNNKKKVQLGNLPSSGGIGGSTGATDNAVLRADGTGGSTLQNSGVTIDDSDNLSGIADLEITSITPSISGGLDIRDNTDNTKVARIDVSNISSGATRTYELPNSNTTLVGTDEAAVLTNKALSALSNTITNIGASEVEAGLIADQTTESTIDGANDSVLVYDASAAALREVLINDLPSSGGGSASEMTQKVYDVPSIISTTSTSFVTADGTNLAITHTADSTSVIVTFFVVAEKLSNTDLEARISIQSGADGSNVHRLNVNEGEQLIMVTEEFTGLTASTSYTFELQFRITAGVNAGQINPQPVLMQAKG